VPEGLPLAISIAIVFSVDHLKNDNLLIKNVHALETAGSLFDIITGKTATLTQGCLKAKYFFTAGEQFNA
jgi:magnesium-transporting ATPase (P-type)